MLDGNMILTVTYHNDRELTYNKSLNGECGDDSKVLPSAYTIVCNEVA